MKPRPVRLEPHFVPRIWGARNLAPFFLDKQSLQEPIGEAWLTGNDCRFADGPFTGEKLGDAWPHMSEDWSGRNISRGKPFPLLAKFIFPEQKLSVQVHPDDDYARKNEAAAGGVGKTEMWYIISARNGAEVRVGLKSGMTRETFRRAIADGSAEECVERVPVSAGDAIFVPAGTVHTIGPGMTICEIQQNSDITYRVFDFNRLTPQGKPRELHIDKSLDVIRFDEQHGGKVVRPELNDTHNAVYTLVECSHFVVAKSVFAEPQHRVKPPGVMEVIIIIGGTGKIEVSGAEIEYANAQAWLVPAVMRDLRFVPTTRTTMLHAHVPGGPSI
ncbi:MAG TPA: type I phosphomannose isomerase catalytic subunit [Candidatus Acidoferrales bacterium]|nr:type I phosphomannose isomerase catalytic subunit [Candidatus Acidoferrales bacterium]